MYLVIDVEEINLPFTQMDIELEDDCDVSIGAMTDYLVQMIKGIKKIRFEPGTRFLLERKNGNRQNPVTLPRTAKLSELSLREWDVLYLRKE